MPAQCRCNGRAVLGPISVLDGRRLIRVGVNIDFQVWRNAMVLWSRVPMCMLAVLALAVSVAGQRREPEPGPPLWVLEDSYLRWPLFPEDQAYGTIDGKRLKQYVIEQ